MGALRIDPDQMTHAASRFGVARDRSEDTIAYLKNATASASAFGTTSAATQFASQVMDARERQLAVQKSARDVHESAQTRLHSARAMADRLVTDTAAVAASAYPR